MDELQVVDDDEIEGSFSMQPVRLGADLRYALHRRVVDVDLGLGQHAHRVHDAPLLRLIVLTEPQARRIDAGLASEESLSELLRRHL